MNFLQLVFKEFAYFFGKLPCKVRNRAGDNNRFYENLWYENVHKSAVFHIDIHCYSYSHSIM